MPTILVIDDEQDSRNLARMMLTRYGYTVLEESDAQAGIAAARQASPDLILMDISMPLLDGWTATRVIKSDPALAHIPVVAWTALSIGGEAGARAAGYDGYLPKPVDMARLLNYVASFLQQPARPQPPVAAAPAPSLQTLQIGASFGVAAGLEVLYRASQLLSASLDPSTVLALILEQATASIEATQGSLYLLDAACQPTSQLHTSGVPDLPENKLKAMFDRNMDNPPCSLLEPSLVDNTPERPYWSRLPGDMHTHSTLIVPLVGREGVLGLLVLDHDRVGHFTHEHIAWLRALTAQAAVSLDNARLFESVRNERKKLSAILDSSADAILVVDDDMRIALANQAALQVLRLHAGSVGHAIQDVLARSPLAQLFDFAALRQEPVSLEVNLDAGVYHATVRPVTGIGYVAALHDIRLLKEFEKIQLERERQETDRVRREFARHVSPQVADVLLRRGEQLGTLRKCQAAILFSDLRNYTGLTERLGLEAVVEYVLKRYLTVMTDMIYAHEGTINKIMGDGIMAVFGVPIPQPNAPQRAVRTALAMQRAFAMLRQGWLRDLGQDIGMGIGLAWGEVIAGDIGGSSQRVDYTVIGDAVNLASRLGELAAPGETLLTEALAHAVGGDSPEWQLEALPPVMIKGKEQPQLVYRANLGKSVT